MINILNNFLRCGPCQYIKPLYEELAKKNPDIQFLKVDYNDQEQLAINHSIDLLPSFVMYRNGKLSQEKISGANMPALTELIMKNKKIVEKVEPNLKPDPKLDSKPVINKDQTKIPVIKKQDKMSCAIL